ncbi:MAG: aldo/keto reductase [Bacteroidales bacterium]|nr:aldo/keto reductase [Bacteroidales bacterium]MCF8458878.1 aldo/keto reductase [Bacteroidales bacterium]
METISLTEDLKLSRFVAGMMHSTQWGMDPKGFLSHIKQIIDMGIDTFDHADIYGDYTCEAFFGEALKLDPGLRNQIKIITKCGIKLQSAKFAERKIKLYDTSYNHIIESVEQSLKNLNIDRIDLLLIHRPDPFMDPAETAKAFLQLEKSGKVLSFGVSNFNQEEFKLLDTFYSGKLVANQLELSAWQLEHFQNNNLDFLQRKAIKPMAWSPLAGGKLSHASDEKSQRIVATAQQISREMDIDTYEKILYAWLLVHPAGIIPVLGTGKIDRIKTAIESLEVQLSREDWFRIYVASLGREVA